MSVYYSLDVFILIRIFCFNFLKERFVCFNCIFLLLYPFRLLQQDCKLFLFSLNFLFLILVFNCKFGDVILCSFNILLINIQVGAKRNQRILNLTIFLLKLLLLSPELNFFICEFFFLLFVPFLVLIHHSSLL